MATPRPRLHTDLPHAVDSVESTTTTLDAWHVRMVSLSAIAERLGRTVHEAVGGCEDTPEGQKLAAAIETMDLLARDLWRVTNAIEEAGHNLYHQQKVSEVTA